MVKRLSLFAIGLAMSGCSLLVDNSVFLGSDSGASQRDSGTRDGGTDAGPNAPTPPEIHIEPAEPRTLDDLSVVIDVESSDPLAAGAITYEYRWLRDAADTGETGTMIAHDLTAKDQVWTVEVTPVTADDRRGVAAIAEVTILNTPPTIRTVGLSTYRPIVGDTLIALPGTVSDPDGDSATVRYTWLIGGTAAASTARQLTLDAALAPTGSEIMIEARAFDGTGESEPATAGPAIVLSNETRWIQHWPDRSNVELVTYDARHERVLIAIGARPEAEPQLWEHDLESDRFVRLRATGSPPTVDLLNVGMHDYDRGRILFLSGTSAVELHELRIAERGQETWQTIPISGTVPSAPQNGGVFDRDRNRILFVSDSELWALDLAGSDAVATMLATGQPGSSGTWVQVPGSGSAYLLGGGDASGSTDLIQRLDFASAELGLQELAVRLPEPAGSLAAAADPDGSRIVFGFGLRMLGVPADGPWVFDLATQEISAGSASDLRVSNRFGTIMLADPPRDRFLIIPGNERIFDHIPYQIFALTSSADAIEAVHVFDDTTPRPVWGPIRLRFPTETVRFWAVPIEKGSS